ncbi:MAG: LamG domain-containing protein, partial [Planctomycetota bacterium]
MSARKDAKILLAAMVIQLVSCSYATADGLVGWWKFDEGKGETIADSSGHGNNGTVFGITAWVDGFVGPKALKITGGGVKIADSPLLRPPKVTVAMWFNLAGKQVPSARLFQKGKDNEETINFQGGEGGIGFSLATAPRENRGINTKHRFEIGKWYHITGIYDGSELRVYVDGKISNKQTVEPFVPYAGEDQPLVIGNRFPDMARPFNGIVDDVRVYTRPLSETEVWELYAWKGRDPVVAALPQPAEEATEVMPSQKLSWTAGRGASKHLVYLGTNADKVAKATTSSSEFKGVQDTNSFNPGKHEFGRAYYWRVDEKSNAGIIKGDVWKFEVVSGKASNPSPGATLKNVATDAKLSWTKSDLATSHDLYFGDDLEQVKNATPSSKVFKGKFAIGNESFDPGPLKEGKYYYWRVDERTSLGTAKGDLWKFRTKGGNLVLQVDFAVKTCDKKEFYPGLAKPGWTIWASDAWTDMYMHDYQIFPLKADGSFDEGGINGTGVTLWMT